MTAALACAGAITVAAGGVATLTRTGFTAGLVAQAVGAALLGIAGLVSLVDGETVGSVFTGSFEPHFGIDPLSGSFLLALGAVGAASLAYATRYLTATPSGRAVGGLTAVFLLAMVLTLCARDPIMFLAGWELMSLAPAAAILVTRGATAEGRRTVFVYIALTHLAGAGTWIAVLLAAHEGALGTAGTVEQGSAIQTAIAFAALVGMGAKAGLMPLHSWLPRAHPIAPAHLSALMSGVMVKIALYGLIRVLVEWCGVLPLWIGAVVLAVGLLSALVGIVYALFQRDLKRLLAFSTVENVGVVVLAIGAALLLRSRGADEWAAVALAAALLHVLTHAICKGLLFLGAGAIERAVARLDIDSLGGLLRRMPVAGTAFLIGCASIAGLPPFGGFASEWLTAKVLLRVPTEGGLGDGLLGAVAFAGLGATAALALFCFAKVAGLVLLGGPRRDTCSQATDPPGPQRWSLAFLAAGCVALGIAPGLLTRSLALVEPWASGAAGTGTHLRPGLSLPDASRLPTVGLALALLVGTGVLLAFRRRAEAAAPAPTWACGQLVEPQLAWTSAGFTKPLRLVLETALRPRREVRIVRIGGVTQSASYQGFVPHLFDLHLYRPAVRLATSAASHARRLQSGQLGVYVGYLMALVIALLALAKWGVIG